MNRDWMDITDKLGAALAAIIAAALWIRALGAL